MLTLSESPAGALSWKTGPRVRSGPTGTELPADVWCAVGLYHNSDAAKTALQSRVQFMPFLANTVESWHAQLMPVGHECECNHFDRDHPGSLFDVAKPDPGGMCMVIATVGFIFGPESKIERVIDFVAMWTRRTSGSAKPTAASPVRCSLPTLSVTMASP